jgi:hypothetical protein
MPAYNFQPRFAPLVRRGVKKQTIRARRRDGRVPKIGQAFIGYTGLRTKNCKHLVTGVIAEVLPIEISPSGIHLNGRQLELDAANRLAVLDGFQHVNEMVGWFIEHHGRHFVGHLIRWR